MEESKKGVNPMNVQFEWLKKGNILQIKVIEQFLVKAIKTQLNYENNVKIFLNTFVDFQSPNIPCISISPHTSNSSTYISGV